MKRVIFIISFILFTVCIANAQIKREVYGIKIGDSKDQAFSVLKSKGLSPTRQTSEVGALYISSGDIFFAGVSWEGVSMLIYEGKVCTIMFTYSNTDGEAASKTMVRLLKNLGEKYSDYALEPDIKETGTQIEFSAKWSDGKTIISYSGTLKKYGESSLYLIYSDIPTMEKIQNSSINEL